MAPGWTMWWLAGALGFEPRNGGTKNRCLTTWRRPNGGGSYTLCRGAATKRRGVISRLERGGCRGYKAPAFAQSVFHRAPIVVNGSGVTEYSAAW